MFNLRKLGRECKKARQDKGYTQLHVAFEVNYTPENVSAFECGRNDNLRIFLWYIQNCFTEESLLDCIRRVNNDN